MKEGWHIPKGPTFFQLLGWEGCIMIGVPLAAAIVIVILRYLGYFAE